MNDRMNIKIYKEERKKANKTIIKAKEAHWRTFCQTINHNLRPTKVWQKLSAIKGAGTRKDKCQQSNTQKKHDYEKANVPANISIR
jgi:hypothetical protein